MKTLFTLLCFLSVARSFSVSHAASRWHLSSLTTSQGSAPSGTRTTTTSNNQFRDSAPLTSTRSGSLEREEEDSSETKKSGFRGKISSGLSKLRAAPFALSIAAFIIGYRLGGKSAASTTAAKAATATAKSTARQFPIIAIILLVVAVRDAWSLVPNWAKKNIPYLGRKAAAASAEGDPDDLTSFAAISLKLKSLFQRGKDKFDSAGVTFDNPVLVFLATLRLMDQAKQQIADRRDKLYRSSGQDVPNPSDVLEGMDEAFEFADWAYDELPEGETLKGNLEAKGYSLLRHEKIALPGHVAHYIAVSEERKEALISIKGTSNFEDMLTDAMGSAVTHDFGESSFVEGGRREIRCHEGVFLSSKRLAEDLFTFVKFVLLPAGYKIRVTGHSLGAGVAVMFSMLLRSQIEELRKDNGDKLKVLAFASPPILDYQASCSCESFVTTYVNNADIVPRCSLSNLVILFEFMKTVKKRLDDANLNPQDFKSVTAFAKMLARSKHDDMILNADEIRDAIDGALDNAEVDDPDHLYVAGKVVHMYDEWSKEGYGDRSDYENVGKDFDESKKVPTAEKVYTADGIARVLRVIEIDDRMMSDHMSAGYRASIRSLLDKADKKAVGQANLGTA